MFASRQRVQAAVLALLLAFAVAAQARTRAECEQIFSPRIGQAGKDVVWVPTPDATVRQMLEMADVGPRDYVIDLGAGDGKIAIAAVKQYGARSHGIEFNADMVQLANCLVEAEGVAGRTRVVHGDIFKEDFSQATVVTLYLLPELNVCLRHRLLAMKPGTRVVTHEFSMGEWQWDATSAAPDADTGSTFLWIVPARVEGRWRFAAGNGAPGFAVDLTQDYQVIHGRHTGGPRSQPLIGASLRGTAIEFAFNDARGVTQTFRGTVEGRRMRGVLRAASGDTRPVEGDIDGAPRDGDWTDMSADCGRYYGR